MPEAAHDFEYVAGLIDVAASRAASMGANALELVVPEFLEALVVEKYGAEPQPLEMGDPWLRKALPG